MLIQVRILACVDNHLELIVKCRHSSGKSFLSISVIERSNNTDHWALQIVYKCSNDFHKEVREENIVEILKHEWLHVSTSLSKTRDTKIRSKYMLLDKFKIKNKTNQITIQGPTVLMEDS